MLKDYKNIIIFVAIIFIIICGAFFYFLEIKKNQEKEIPQIPPEKNEEYPYANITFNLTGIVKEKGEDWILVEDKTPNPSPLTGGNKSPNFIKIKVVPESKIAKGNRLISLQAIEFGDYVLLKTSQINETLSEATASDIFILPSQNRK